MLEVEHRLVQAQYVIDHFGHAVLGNVDGVDLLVQLVQAEQLDQVGIHAISLVDHSAQVLVAVGLQRIFVLRGQLLQHADLHIQRIFHVVDR